MEACIEALFNIEGENGKRKTIEMIRVLKGAISVSKSRTGEVIYHYNRHEKKALWRQLAKYDRDTRRSRLDIEHQKRDILRKWSLVFGRQRNFCESIRVFDDMLAEAIILRDRLKDLPRSDSDDEEEDELEKAAAEAQAKQEEEEEAKKKLTLRMMEDPRKRRIQARLNPASDTISTGPAPTTVGMLPKLKQNAGILFNGRIETEEEEKARLEKEAEEERKRKAKELPRFDRELVKDYLKEQKHMHEDLLTRNALMRIKSQAEHDHVFFKYRMKTKLPGSAQNLLHQLEQDRQVEPESRSLTRQSTRSDSQARPSTRSDCGTARPSTRGDFRQSALPASRLSTRQGMRPNNPSTSKAVQTTCVTSEAEPTPVVMTARLTQTADAPAPLRLERAKTVHFS